MTVKRKVSESARLETRRSVVVGCMSVMAADRDIEIAGGSVDVRATRDGGGNGRVYTIFATVTDRAGNLTEAQATCTVPHDLRRSVP